MLVLGHIRQRLADAHPDVPDFQRDLTVTISQLAGMDLAEGNRKAARDAYVRSLDISQRLADAHPDVPQFQRDLTVSQCALAAVDICDGKISDALRLYRQMRDTMLRLAGSDGAELLYQVDLAEYALWLALLEPAEALGPNDPALALFSKLVLLERGSAVDSLPGRISALRTTLARLAISPARRTEIATAQALLRAMDGSGKLDQSAKDWLALIDVALAAPPAKKDKRRGLFSRMFASRTDT